MKFRLSLFTAASAVALLSAVSQPASAVTGYTWVGGEAGFKDHEMPSTTTRADVQRQFEAWKRNPQDTAGWREVGGEAGWQYVGTTSSTTRAEVQEALRQAQRNPVSADGWLQVGGEAGAVYVGKSAARAAGSCDVRMAGRKPDANEGQTLWHGGYRAGVQGSC